MRGSETLADTGAKRSWNKSPGGESGPNDEGASRLSKGIIEARLDMIEIVPYQTSWPAEFQEIALVLRRGLGGLALRIDHIGSTSVPGLPAKDIIDIQRET